MIDDERFVSWLQDAYAMEESILQVLEAQSTKESPLYPGIKAHITETKHHQDILKSCLERYSTSPSAVTISISWLSGKLGLIGSGIFSDGVLPELLSSIAAEQYEIAAYRALVVAASNLGDEKSVLMFEEIIKDEERMARFLTESIKIVINRDMEKHEE